MGPRPLWVPVWRVTLSLLPHAVHVVRVVHAGSLMTPSGTRRGSQGLPGSKEQGAGTTVVGGFVAEEPWATAGRTTLAALCSADRLAPPTAAVAGSWGLGVPKTPGNTGLLAKGLQ
ncbi:hypothetical protein NDU88_002866 [Pleurodeles waltl]|uniref:Secreted protein n=1 Tax=Pleurodeles waltl TaxID=8319 RepID=A0AAV7WMD4_PLEWA|nr:hypothetical protein NDU88_002866 [Pleurodeles waltl]